MMTKVNDMLGQLKTAETMEQMVEVEDQIAAAIGNGFLKSELDYGSMQQFREQVELVEREKRENLSLHIPLQQKGHTR